MKIHPPTLIIQTNEHQTSHAIFPRDIIYIDVGDNENLIADYTNNILRIKGINNHPTTNLTVITEEKNYYSFYVQFAPNPPLNYFISKEQRIHNIRTSPALVDIDKSAPHENTVSYNSLDQKGKTDNTNNTASSKQTSKLVALETAPNQVNSTKAPNRQTAIHSDFDEDEKEEKMNLASLLRLKQTAWEVLKDPSHHPVSYTHLTLPTILLV